MSGTSAPAGLRRNTLSTWGLFFFAVSASAPETAVLGGLVAAVAIGGPEGVPAVFAVLTVALLLFAVGYVAVGQQVRHAGPLYAYVAPTGTWVEQQRRARGASDIGGRCLILLR